LSPEWFDELRADELQGRAPAGRSELVVGVAVSGVPGAHLGRVHYQVAVRGRGAAVFAGADGGGTAQVVLTADYATMAGVASGRISALDAMAAGRARITGNTAELSAHQSVLETLDLVPSAVRASTHF
jgi:hypothetical protein